METKTATKRKPLSPETREKISRIAKEAFANGTRPRPVVSERHKEILRKRFLEDNPRRYMTEDSRRRQAEKIRGRKLPPEAVAAISERNRGREPTSPMDAKGPQNRHASELILRDPYGNLHHVQNLVHFVRENEKLFLPDDVEWRPTSRSRNAPEGSLLQLFCRASKGLAYIARFSPGRHIWKGWTLFQRIK